MFSLVGFHVFPSCMYFLGMVARPVAIFAYTYWVARPLSPFSRTLGFHVFPRRVSCFPLLRSLSCDVVGVTSDVGKGDRCVADINKCRQAHLSRHVDPFLHLSSYEEGQPYLFTSVRMRRAFAIQPKFSGQVCQTLNFLACLCHLQHQ